MPACVNARMPACMHACMYECTYVRTCMRACVRACVHCTYICTRARTYARVFVHVRTYAHMHPCLYIRMHARLFVCMYVRTCLHPYTHRYVRTYVRPSYVYAGGPMTVLEQHELTKDEKSEQALARTHTRSLVRSFVRSLARTHSRTYVSTHARSLAWHMARCGAAWRGTAPSATAPTPERTHACTCTYTQAGMHVHQRVEQGRGEVPVKKEAKPPQPSASTVDPHIVDTPAVAVEREPKRSIFACLFRSGLGHCMRRRRSHVMERHATVTYTGVMQRSRVMADNLSLKALLSSTQVK